MVRTRIRKPIPLTAVPLTTAAPVFTTPALTVGLTAGQLARRLAARWPDRERMVVRIKHWVRQKLLVPASGENPGAGQHHLFTDLAVVDVAVLAVIADRNISITEPDHMLVIAALARCRDAYQQWLASGKKLARYLILRGVSDGGQHRVTLDVASTIQPQHLAAESLFVINLHELFAHIEGA